MLNNTKQKDKQLTTQQAADKLDRTRSRILQLIYEKVIPAEKIGRDYLIKKSDLDLVVLKKPTGRPRLKRR